MIGTKRDCTTSHPGPPVPEELIACGSGTHFCGIFVATTSPYTYFP
jgi:hypothetical protein